MLRALFVASFATISGAGVTSADEVDAITVSSVDIAQAYLDAYASYDMSLLDPFLADNAEFHDDTSSDQSASGGPFNFVGKVAILEGLGDYAAQFEQFYVEYDLARRWESNDVVVFIGDLSYHGIQIDGPEFFGSIAVVSVITVRDGKVVLHKDYLDYEGNLSEE